MTTVITKVILCLFEGCMAALRVVIWFDVGSCGVYLLTCVFVFVSLSPCLCFVSMLILRSSFNIVPEKRVALYFLFCFNVVI